MNQPAIIIDPERDNVAVATGAIGTGSLFVRGQHKVAIQDELSAGDRFTLCAVDEGQPLLQYGFPFAVSMGIGAGAKVTTRNISERLPKVAAVPDGTMPATPLISEYQQRTFMGYQRPNGTCGTRNYYLVIPTSMCASATAARIAERITDLPEGIDGVIPLPNTEGCGCAGGMQIDRFLTVLRNFIVHANVAGALLVDLGCEQTNRPAMGQKMDAAGLAGRSDLLLDWLTIQEEGGTRKAVAKGIDIVTSHLARLEGQQRVPCPLSALVVAAECGASDAFSGISANRVIGNVVDKIIYGGGTGLFSETPEMRGAEPFLMPRMRNRQVASRFTNAMNWYEQIARKLGTTMDDNLVPENRAGGLLNPCIKSLGAVMKGGTTVIEGVLDYGEQPAGKGLHLMQGPGNDLESVTGLAASGANIICFSTGRGTVTGSAIVPVIKISSTSQLYKRMPDDIDFDAGPVLKAADQRYHVDHLGEQLLDMVVSVASGTLTKPEQNGQRQFQIWTAGKLSL